MKLKKLAAVMLAALTCLFTLAGAASAAAKKGVSLNKSKVTISVGDTATLKYTVTGYKKYTIQWSSSDKTVATIQKGGIVTAKKAGTATITCKIKGTSYKATCKVTVKKAGITTTASKTAAGTAMDFVKNIKVGWNLGNTMDSINCSWLTDENYETGWGNPMTTKAMIDTVKKAGFNAVRIPVSWGNHMDSSGKVNDAWMDRVQEVVDYAYDNGMYVILNVHHDMSWIKLTEKDQAAVNKKFGYLWKQIAARFKDYDEKLIFEGINEPRTEGSAAEWNGGTAAERKVLNSYYETFVSTVRAAGGNNKTRYLMLTPYGANSSKAALSGLAIPDDDRIIVSVHAYLPYNMALNTNSKETTLSDAGKKEIDSAFANINEVFLSKGIPVIMGEFGSINKNNTNQRVELAEYYLSVADKYGVPCFWWDNNANKVEPGCEGFQLLDRKTLKWTYPEIVKVLTK